MNSIFDEEKYREASKKAYDFMVRQLNVNNYTLFPVMVEDYEDYYTGRIFATVEMPADAEVNYPGYIFCDQFYDHEYQGICSGRHQNTGDARRNLGVEVTAYTDQKYRSAICPLHEDGTWHSETYYKETDYYGIGFGDDEKIVKYERFWYKKDEVVNSSGSNGLKGFELKYYRWLDEDGSEIDVDHLPPKETWEDGEYAASGSAEKPHYIKSETYTLRPVLVDDTPIDDALPKYAGYDTIQYVYADVEYRTEAQGIIYDGDVQASDLPENPPKLPVLPEPSIMDDIVQPGTTEAQLIITWITNFEDACTLNLNGTQQTVTSSVIADGYFTYHATVDVADQTSYEYTITGKGAEVKGAFQYGGGRRYLVVGDPQITTAETAEIWYKVQNILPDPPALIISMGDQVDSIIDALLRKEQYHQFTKQQTVPIATVRGNHDRNDHYFGHYGLPNAADGNWYFRHNEVLFIEIDSNSTDVVAHKGFISAALAAEEHKWAILLMHHSMYSTSTRALIDATSTLRKGLTDFIVKETDIDMVFAGHEHFLSHTTFPGKLFFTCPSCTGSKYYLADNTDVEWSQVTIDSKTPKYTVMDVMDDRLVLTTYDLDGTILNLCTVTK